MSKLKPTIISFATLKGGVGKTMTTFNITGLLSEKGKKVLAIDADPQANLSSNLGFDAESLTDNGEPYGMSQIFKIDKEKNAILNPASIDINKVIIKAPNELMPNVDLIPSHIFLTTADSDLSSKYGKEKILKKFVATFEDELSKYDYILIDTNPSLSLINTNAYFVSDHIVLVSDTSINSITGLEKFMDNWQVLTDAMDTNYNVSAILLNNVDNRTNYKDNFFSYCEDREELKELLLTNYIPQSAILKNCEITSRPIVYAPSKDATKIIEIYNNLYDELVKKEIL